MRLQLRRPTVPAILLAVVGLGIGGCNGGGSETSGSGAGRTPHLSLTAAEAEQVRQAVIAGVVRDFRTAVQGPRGFEDCFESKLRGELTRDRLEQLVGVHAANGNAEAAQTLNALGAPLGDECGGRQWVPELTEAASGLAPRDQADAGERPPSWNVKTTCPEEIRILERPSCKLISRPVELMPCPGSKVGHTVRVSRLSCSNVFDLLTPLGGAAGFATYKHSQQKLTRPAVAT